MTATAPDPYNGASAFPRMADDRWMSEPIETRREIERLCWAHWPGRVRAATATRVGSDVPTDWLNVARGRHLEAFDVPVGRMFTALAIARRGRG